MTRRRLLTVAAGLCSARAESLSAGPEPVTESLSMARRRVLETSRRLAADGWKVREGLFTAHLKPGQTIVVPVHLIEGVQYLFAGVSRPSDRAFSFDLLDADGRLLAAALSMDDARTDAVLHTAAVSALCHVRLRTLPRSLPADIALLYVYR